MGMSAPAPLGRRRRRGGVFRIAQLFANGEAGAVYDPSDLTAEKVAWALANPGFTSAQFLAAFPTHTLFQDSAGTTPVTALGQPVGLVIDSKTGGLANLGPELITNGDFSSGSSGWTLGIGWSVGSGIATKAAGTGDAITRTAALIAGRTYRVSFTVSGATAGTCAAVLVGGTQVTGSLSGINGDRVEYVTAVSGNNAAGITANGSFNGSIDNISVREVPGVHAIQPTSASRPLLDARVNLLRQTEDITNVAIWSTSGSPTLTANAGVAPDGTTTADQIVATVGGGSGVYQAITNSASGITYEFLAHIKHVTGGTTVSIGCDANPGTGTVQVNASTGAIVSQGASVVASSVTNVGNGWFAVRGRYVSTGAVNTIVVYPTISGGTILAWGADLRLAADAAYPYQRVAAATDYADVGVPRSFLFDGVDDSLYTASNMDLSGTDKVTVLAGVQKLSDAATAIVVELGNRNVSQPGSFSIDVPATNRWRFILEGTQSANYSSAPSYASPVTNILSASNNLAQTALAAELIPRINGVVDQSVPGGAADVGTGNFGSYVLFIGRRNNASLPFNGKAYQLIVRGALTDAGTLVQAERYVAQRTGITL